MLPYSSMRPTGVSLADAEAVLEHATVAGADPELEAAGRGGRDCQRMREHDRVTGPSVRDPGAEPDPLRAPGRHGEHGQAVEPEPARQPGRMQSAPLGVDDRRQAALQVAHLADVQAQPHARPPRSPAVGFPASKGRAIARLRSSWSQNWYVGACRRRRSHGTGRGRAGQPRRVREHRAQCRIREKPRESSRRPSSRLVARGRKTVRAHLAALHDPPRLRRGLPRATRTTGG